MEFKLPDRIPELRNSAQDWADYAEYQSIHKSQISLLDLVKPSLLISDEIEVDGIVDETDKYNNKADDIAGEIRERIRLTNGRYPFELGNEDYTVRIVPAKNNHFWIYKFLLLATRLRMTRDNVHKGYDGTLLFEKLSGSVALNYFGDRTEVDVFGTSTKGMGFKAKMEILMKKLREGGRLRVYPNHRPQDDNIDIVAWKAFTDQLSSQLIAFGQCKTGTSWRNNLTEMIPEIFCKTWFTDPPVVTPIRMFFCAQYFPRDNWQPMAYSAGLVFDRFRIMDYLPENIDEELLKQIREWVEAAELLYVN